jgi:glycosyltransferase involved in cell wall biosynthesis
MKLSVLMPVFNESRWIEAIVQKVLTQKVEGISDVELVIVDDGSTDGTQEHLKKLAQKYGQQICLYAHEKNMGKGAALQTAIQHMSGDLCIVQDADLEYDPHDYPLLLEPIIQGRADCVYGSRFIGMQSKRVLYFWHYVGNKLITWLSNMFTNLNLTDMETCYKAFRCNVLKSIRLRSQRFGFDPEVTAKIAKKKCRIFEVGISYNGRTYEDGKKITWWDGVQAILLIIKYRMVD